MQRRYPDGPVAIGMANEGGGTRKSTGGVNACVELARRGKKVWLIDGDPTMIASCYLGYGVTNQKYNPQRVKEVYDRLDAMTTIYDVVLGEAKLTEALVPARTRIKPSEFNDDPHADDDDHFEVIPNLFLAVGSRAMSQASASINDITKATCDEYWLRRAIEDLPPEEAPDVIVVDFRGAVDTLEISYLCALDYIVGCLKPDPKDDDTLTKLESLIEQGRRKFQFSGGSAEMRHVLFNGYVTNRGAFFVDKWKQTLDFYGEKTLPYISENVQFYEAMEAQEPVLYWCGENSKAAKEFAKVVDNLDLISH